MLQFQEPIPLVLQTREGIHPIVLTDNFIKIRTSILGIIILEDLLIKRIQVMLVQHQNTFKKSNQESRTGSNKIR